MTLRIIDFISSLLGLLLLFPVLIIIFVIGFFTNGSPLFIQERVGKNQKLFTLVKFRTMRRSTQSVASHLVSADSITPFGSFLRRTKLDELPQLWNVFIGDMSLVGPRPNLPNQSELIAARENLKVYSVLPGITGLAQIQNIDMSTPELLAKTDREMIDVMSIKTYISYIIQTVTGSGSGDAVK